MRRGSKPELIYIGDVLVAVNLSADYCAEHEWGIARLRDEFGIPDGDNVYGMKRRKITRVPNIEWVEYAAKWTAGKRDVENGLAKVVGDALIPNQGFVLHSWYGKEPYKLAQNSELYGIGLRTAWSEDDLAAVSNDPEQVEALREIYDAIKKKDACIFFGGGGPFLNPGLMIAIASRVPSNFVADWKAFDKDRHAIKKEFKATGIEALLAKAGKRYFALSPRRKDDGTLWYWLNPYEREDNYGWFELEDLKLWAVGEGPIPKVKKESMVN